MNPLENKQIVLAVTGSIAAVDTIRLAHELRRRGADVIPVMSDAATHLISPESLTYACGHPCITKITGRVEHVAYCGVDGTADLLLIAPSTANTISKIAMGIDDTAVTTFATTAIGRGMPIVLAPAMHESMYCHPAVRKNITILQDNLNISLVPPKMEEDRAKIADTETICLYAERALTPPTLKNKTVLITSGTCRETVDSVRILTTRSTGIMGRELALEAFRRGAEVTVVSNTAVHGTIPCVTNIRIETSSEMRNAVITELEKTTPDYYVSAAAISDFIPEPSKTKIPSGMPTAIHLIPAPKLITAVTNTRIIGFKIGETANTDAQKLMDSHTDIIAVAANQPETMGSCQGTYTIFRRHGEPVLVSGTKKEIAQTLWNAVL